MGTLNYKDLYYKETTRADLLQEEINNLKSRLVEYEEQIKDLKTDLEHYKKIARENLPF